MHDTSEENLMLSAENPPPLNRRTLSRIVATLNCFVRRSMLCIALADGAIALSAHATEQAPSEELGETPSQSSSPMNENAAEQPLDFGRDVQTIFTQHCTKCHGGVKQASGVSFIYREQMLGEGDSGEKIVVPGHADQSELYRRVSSDDESERMPPEEESPEGLSKHEIATLKRWIESGAKVDEHWAYVRPKKIAPSATSLQAWSRSAWDPFILARLEAAGLKPAPEAERHRWLRRVTFDLTGVPPTLDEIETFLADQSDQAYEKVVDRLLDSPRYGERWAAIWLDLARCADSTGYERDPLRVVWPYRDWVIRALNADMPYDEFTVKQLAGDLLENPTLDDLVATEFNRNSQTNTEGGTDDEEFRLVAAIDRVSTTWTVWQGQTFGCVQCHAHPYAPFRHKEFYEFVAFFNNAVDCDLSNEYPTLRVPADRALDAVQMERIKEKDRLASEIMAPFQTQSAEAKWQGMKIESVASTKEQAKLTIREQDGASEVFAAGNVALNSVYTIGASTTEKTISALRIDVPLLEGDDAANPSPGFVVTKIRLQKQPAEGKSEDVSIAITADDEADGMFWSPERWGVFPNQFHDRHCVVVPSEPIEMAAGDRLILSLEHNYYRDGAAPPVLRRFRLSTDSRPIWQSLASAADHAERMKRRAELVDAIAKTPGVWMPVMQERTKFRRDSALFHRGNWLDKTDRVESNVPNVLPPLPKTAQRDRLAMARWLTSDENPLTARVMVNRLWGAMFGRGIVETEEDFGPVGSKPTHPELLDALAIRFQFDHRWRIKPLLREIALSAVYRQSSVASQQAKQRDPLNELISRGPRERLTAEMVRDHALASAGLLSAKMYGPPVMPPQPDGLWQTVYSNLQWKTSEGEDRYRRGLYTFWRRTSPYPGMEMFDAPSRQICSARRIATNTPLQALASMNDPVYLEASRGLARRMKREGGAKARDWIAHGLLLALSRPADEADVAVLLALYGAARTDFQSRKDDSQRLAETADDAALVLVANTILNLDEALNK